MKNWIIHLTTLSVEAEDEDGALKEAEKLIREGNVEIAEDGVEEAKNGKTFKRH